MVADHEEKEKRRSCVLFSIIILYVCGVPLLIAGICLIVVSESTTIKDKDPRNPAWLGFLIFGGILTGICFIMVTIAVVLTVKTCWYDQKSQDSKVQPSDVQPIVPLHKPSSTPDSREQVNAWLNDTFTVDITSSHAGGEQSSSAACTKSHQATGRDHPVPHQTMRSPSPAGSFW